MRRMRRKLQLARREAADQRGTTDPGKLAAFVQKQQILGMNILGHKSFGVDRLKELQCRHPTAFWLWAQHRRRAQSHKVFARPWHWVSLLKPSTTAVDWTKPPASSLGFWMSRTVQA